MFTFQWPWLALLLPLPLLVRWLWQRQQSLADIPQLRLPIVTRVQQAFQQADISQLSRYTRWYDSLLWLCWLGLITAFMYPQWLNKYTEVTQSGYDLMLAVDLSGSMAKTDFHTPQGQRIMRIDAVKLVLTPFIQRRTGDRIGLILFADHAYLQAPLTLDNLAIQNLLEKAELGMAGQETAIGDALGLAVKKLRERPEGSRIIILLTDGDNNAGNLIPLQAAQLAKQYNIRIYTIGVGEQGGGFRRGLNERPLSEIAQLTGGIYFSAEDLSALKQVYDHIDQTLQKTEAESRIYMQRTPLYQWPLGIAMLALLGLPILRWYFGELA